MSIDVLSLEQRISALPVEQQAQVLDGVDLAALRWSWEWTARPDQLTATESLARIVLMLMGRGGGKTRSGAEWIRKKTRRGPPKRFALVGRTAADVRDTMVQGESGLQSVFPPGEMPRHIESKRRVEFADGSLGLCFSAEEPKQLRGPQFHYTWADELAMWQMKPDETGATAWDNVQFSTRLGDNPQIFVTTTPKKLPLIRSLRAQGLDPNDLMVSLHTGTTHDNIHLSEAFVQALIAVYSGTRLEAQEMLGLVMDDVEGALWAEKLLESLRIYDDPGTLPLRVVGVDPTTADQPHDECGIVVVGATGQAQPVLRTGYVLADATIQGPPTVWAARVVQTATKWNASIVAEANQGGALVREVIRNTPGGERLPIKLVHAYQGKALRAEPVAMAYDQGRMIHVGRFPELEDQQTTWVPAETVKSPDRIDALVHAATALVVPQASKVGLSGPKVSSPARRAPDLPTGAGVLTRSRRGLG